MNIVNQKCNRREYSLGASREISLSWCYEGGCGRNVTQKNYSIKIALDENMKHIVYKTGRVRSDDMTVSPADFKPEAATGYYWTVDTVMSDGSKLTSEVAYFETAIDGGDFAALEAKWLTTGLEAEKEPASVTFTRTLKCKDIADARIYYFGVGFVSLTVNGYVISSPLTPANSDYSKHCYFETYDITPVLPDGDNEIALNAAGGYNRDYIQFGYRHMGAMGVRAVIRLTDCDGNIENIVTDGDWTWRENEITASSLYGGETYDARRCDLPDHRVVINEDASPKGELLPCEMPNITITDIKEEADTFFPDPDGGTVYDFGENLTGIPSISVKAPAGTVIKLEHAEMVTYEGRLSPWTNRRADATDTYICSGEGEEYYTPTTTYHGFRYIRVTGAEKCRSFEIAAIRLAADVACENSVFTCSDPTINRIQQNAQNSLLSNLVTIPTDCNMRDERTPCHMDSMCVEEAACYNFDMAAYYRKWGADCAGDTGNADWNCDQISVAWHLYEKYGDLYLARRYYDDYKNQLDHLQKTSNNYIFDTDNGCGDWCHVNDGTWGTIGGDNHELHTALFYIFARRMAVFAEKLGKERDIAKFTKLADKIKTEFNRRMVGADGTVHGDRQTSYLMPLYFGLADERTAPLMYSKLIERINATGHLDVGIFGMIAYIDVPSLGGNADDVFATFRTSEFPGFGWQIANGAKSLWEEWAYTGVMHSHNHAMFASVSASFYKIFAGITCTAPAFRSVRIMPVLPRGLSFAYADVKTASGSIVSRIERVGGSTDGRLDWTNMTVVIPANVCAEVHIPVYTAEGVETCLLDGDRKLDKKAFRFENGYYITKIGSGSYNFRVIPASILYPDTNVTFTYTFTNDDGEVIKSATVHYGTVVVPPEGTPKKSGDDSGEYEFTGWSNYTEGMRLPEGNNFTAQYKKK